MLPTSSTTTTTTTTTTTSIPSTTTTTTPAAPAIPEEAAAGAGDAAETVDESEGEAAKAEGETAPAVVPAAGAEIEHTPKKSPEHDLNKETIGDILIDQLETVAKTTERRSSHQPHLTAKVLMHNQSRINHLTEIGNANNWLTQRNSMYSNPHKVLPSKLWLLQLNFNFFSLSFSLSLADSAESAA